MMDQPLAFNSESSDRLARRRFVIICLCFVLLCLALKPMTWFAPRAEYDEQVYWTVARHLLQTGQYTLQGTGAIEALQLPRYIYDRPFFHHPPLFPVLLIPFAAAKNPNAAILISWLGHVLAIVGIALTCWAWRRPSWRGTEMVLWLPVLAVAVDPLMMFCSRKLWMDSLVGGLDALGLGLTAMAVSKLRISWFVGAGVAFGLAGLSKLTGVLPVIPALVWAMIALRHERRRVSMVLALAGPVTLLVFPWLLIFRIKAGAWMPQWVAPPSELVATNPRVAKILGRSWHYYLTQSVMVAPVTIVCALRLFATRGFPSISRSALGAATIVIVVMAMIVLGVRGMGMQLRYLSPAVGGLYALLAAQLGSINFRRSFYSIVVLVCVIFGAIQTGFYLQAVEYDEIVSLPEMAWMAITGTSSQHGGGG